MNPKQLIQRLMCYPGVLKMKSEYGGAWTVGELDMEDFVAHITKEHEAELAALEAQVAVMTELLESVDYYEPDWEGGDVFEVGIGLETGRAIRDALSAAPKVVWSGEANVNMYYDLVLTDRGRKALGIGRGRAHTNVDVIILDKPEAEEQS